MHSAKRFFRRWQNWLALFLVALFLGMAIAAPLISPIEPSPENRRLLGNRPDPIPRPPSAEEPLGTLPKEISVFHQIVWGSRSALSYGLGVTVIIATIGTLIGMVSAYLGGWIGRLLMWITDSFMAFPVIAGVVLINQVLMYFWERLLSGTVAEGVLQNLPPGQTTQQYLDFLIVWVQKAPALTPGEATQQLLYSLFIWVQRVPPLAVAFVLFLWMPYARVMHVSVLQKLKMEYILAAKVSGVRNWRILWRHLIPNAIGPVVVMAAKDIGAVVVLQSAFNFAQLGVGGSPWSGILIAGKDYLYAPGGLVNYWWLFLPATTAIILFGVAWNLLGDGINEAMNPMLTNR